MKEFQQKKKIEKIKHSKVVMIVLVFFIFILCTSIIDLFQKKRQVLKLQKESRFELQKIQEKSAVIENEFSLLDTAQGKERLIREKYNVKTEGEGVVIVTDQEVANERIPVVRRDIWYSITQFFEGILDKAKP
jgi:cell division protein FtsB